MNYKELQQTTYDHGLSKNYLFETIMIERNKASYDLKELSEKIIKHTKMGSRFKLGVNEKLKKLAEFLSPVKIEIVKNVESKKKCWTISEISKKFQIKESAVYGIFSKYHNFEIIPCKNRPSGQKAFTSFSIMDAFQIAQDKNLVPSQKENLERINKWFEPFWHNNKEGLTQRELDEVANKLNTVLKPLEPNTVNDDINNEVSKKAQYNIDTLIKLTEKTNTLLEKLISIWE